jgi:hypothetical protein
LVLTINSKLPSATIIGRPCRPRQLCRLWRECDRCCRIRQAKFADRAEAAAAFLIVPGLTVLIPHDGTRASAERLRRWYAEKVKPKAAIWSIEYGRHGTGYHLNVIAEHIADLAPPGARVLAAPIRSTVRATAAYITKRSQTPPREALQKRNTGYFGTIIETLVRNGTGLPVVKAAALQTLLTRAEPKANEQPAQTVPQKREHTKAEYHEFAHVALTQLRQINEQLNSTTKQPLRGSIKDAADALLNEKEPFT